MSLDLYEKETAERMTGLQPVQTPESSAFDGFARGTGQYTMRTFATAGRALSMAGAAVPVVIDAVTGGAELQDKYFKFHDDVFGSAVDFWTPRPNEVGAAGQIVGTMLGTIPTIIASPSAAVAATQLSVSEDLVREGVDSTKAMGVGAVQAVGLGLGIYVPIFGKSLWQRTLLGGAGFNVVQGAAMRGASVAILEGTPAAEQFRAFDSEAMTLDLLMGAAFGVVSHLSPRQRAEGERAWNKLAEWGQRLKPTEVDSLLVLRGAQHKNVDSLPGKPVEATDVTAHTDRLQTAIEQLLRDEPVNVDDLPAGRFDPVPERFPEAEARAQTLMAEAERIRVEEGIPRPPETEGPPLQTEPPLGEGTARPSDISRAASLSQAERAVETRFAEQIRGDLEGTIRAYSELPDSLGGKVINADIARELSPDYVANRSTLASAVHEPASYLVKEIYKRRLAEPDPTGLNTVTFTAGGTGAGKTTAISNVPDAQIVTNASHVVYDTNMSSFGSAVDKIDQALKANKDVKIITVVRDPVESLVNGALPRAMQSGRTAPLSAHAHAHKGAADTIPQLMQKYQGDKRVQFLFVDNTRGMGESKLAGVELLKKTNFDNLELRLRKALEEEYRNGKISEEVYRGTLGDVARTADRSAQGDDQRGARPSDRGIDGRESQQADRADPLKLEAERFAAENPDAPITLGRDANGDPITKTVREYLDETRAEADRARQDVPLYELAAACILGAM